jgi:hypothetical protein
MQMIMTTTNYLTGLDPAGPSFSGKDCAVRFCKGDADFTEVIHTNGNPTFGYGTSDFDGRNTPS